MNFGTNFLCPIAVTAVIFWVRVSGDIYLTGWLPFIRMGHRHQTNVSFLTDLPCPCLFKIDWIQHFVYWSWIPAHLCILQTHKNVVRFSHTAASSETTTGFDSKHDDLLDSSPASAWSSNNMVAILDELFIIIVATDMSWAGCALLASTRYEFGIVVVTSGCKYFFQQL